ncbi:MAG: hypothetical protein WCS94_13160 [Verrucomicrobiota bacterium]
MKLILAQIAFRSCYLGTVALALVLASVAQAQPQVTLYPAPGDLSTVEHLRESTDYTVSVNGRPCFVYESENYWQHDARMAADKLAFAIFDFKGGPATVEVNCKFAVNTVKIRPVNDNVQFTRDGNKITFTVNGPKQLSIEVNDRKRPLFIFASEPEQPDTNAQHYFGPGVHHIGAKYPVKANERVYLAGGAVVEGTFLCEGENIKIGGRGIVSAGQWTREEWQKDKQLSLITHTTGGNHDHHEYSGVVLLNSPGWFVNGYGQYLTCSNLKVIGWGGNTDAPHLNGHSLFEHSFIFNNDDSLISNRGDDNIFRDCVVWKGPWGHPMVSLNPSNQQNLLFEDIDIIADEQRNKFGTICITFGGGSVKTVHGSGTRQNYTYRNIRIEEPRTAILLKLDVGEGSRFENVRLENITAAGQLPFEGMLNASKGGVIDHISFKNVQLNGVVITNLAGANLTSQGNVTNVTFLK